jgi:hypothetical protein
MIYLDPAMPLDYRIKLTRILDEFGVPYIIEASAGRRTDADDNMTEKELHYLWTLVVERMNKK